MAMFNIIASIDDTVDFYEILRSISEMPRRFVNIFPVVSSNLQSFDGVGITVSGKELDNLFKIKEELFQVLVFLWEKKFIVRELYNGKVLTSETYKVDLDYFWNLPHQL